MKLEFSTLAKIEKGYGECTTFWWVSSVMLHKIRREKSAKNAKNSKLQNHPSTNHRLVHCDIRKIILLLVFIIKEFMKIENQHCNRMNVVGGHIYACMIGPAIPNEI